MRRSTRRSSMAALSLDSALHSNPSAKFPPPQEPRNPVGNFTTKFSMSSFIKKVEELTHDQRTAIEKVGFGNVLRIPYHSLRKNLLVEWMERWDCEKRAFILLDRKLTITPIDAALILGLPVTGLPVILNDDEPFTDLEEEYGATAGTRKISVSSIQRRLESLGDSADEEFIRTFLLFTFGTLLFHNSVAKIDSPYISLLKDLDTVSSYAWGVAVLEELFNCLSRWKEEQAKNMEGCIILLQIWSYEHIDIGRPIFVGSSLGIPRACCWESSRCTSSRQWFATKFNDIEENQVMWKLQVSEAESNLNIIKQLLEAETEGGEVDCHDANKSRSTMITSSTQRMKLPPKSIRKEATLSEEPKKDPRQSKHEIADNISHNSEISEETVEQPECSSSLNLKGDHIVETSQYVQEDYRLLKTENIRLKQEMSELQRENALLRNKLSLYPSLEEISKLEKELGDLKEENQNLKLSADTLDRVDRLILEYFDGAEDAPSSAK